MFHPYVIDTSIIYNMSGNRSIKAGLRKLTSFFLSRNIQNSPAGHCSAEDAKATLDLVKLKLKKGLEFGDATISGVYFPSIETYFLGETDGKNRTAENIEDETASENTTKSSHEHQQAADLLASRPTSEKAGQSTKRPHSGSSASDSDEDSGESEKKRHKLSEDASKKSAEMGKDGDKISNARHSMESSDVKWTTTQQKTIFSQKNSVHVSRSFFKLVYEAGRSGCLIARPSLTSKYIEEPIETVTAANDSEARKCAKTMVQRKEFVWGCFSEYKEAVSSRQLTLDETQKLRRKLDHRVRSVMKKVRENALVVLLVTGRQQSGDINNAGVFIKTT